MAELGPRHARDAVSLVLGLLLLSVAALYLVHDLSDVHLDLRWVGPALLIGIGLAGLGGSVRRRDPR